MLTFDEVVALVVEGERRFNRASDGGTSHGISRGLFAAAAGRWIRTSGSAPDKGSGPRFRFAPELMATDDGSRRIDGGMQPKPAMFALSRACIERGTGSSNPSPSSNESVENSLSRTAANSASRKPEFSEHVCLLVAVGHDHSREPNARSVSFISCEGHGANHCEVDRARHIQSRRAHRRLRSDRRPLALGRLDPDPSCRRKSSAN